MKNPGRIGRVISVAAVLLLVGCGLLFGQQYPRRPINTIIPFAAGGGSDTAMRELQPALERELGVRLNFVYRPGAGGALGYRALGESRGDGYTIGAVNWPHVLMPVVIQDDPGYDLERLQPVAVWGRDTAVLAVRKDSSWRSFDDLLQDSKRRPGRISLAAPVPNGYLLGGILGMEDATGIKLRTIWFDGGADSAHAFLGGHADVWVINGSVMRRYADEIRPLAVLGADRVSYFPEVPTFAELGYPTVHAYTYRAIVAPAGTDRSQLRVLSDALQRAINDPELIAKMMASGVELYFMDTAALERFSSETLADVRRLIAQYGIIQ